MAARRGNKSTYSGNLSAYASPDEKDFREFSDDELAEAWKRSCWRDPFAGHYDRLKNANSPIASLNCIELRHALEFLHDATGDKAFQAAVLAMKHHGFTRGGVKTTALAKMSKQKRAAWAAMPKVHEWVENGKVSPTKAAKLVAAQIGICGRDFLTVAECLRKTYPKWLKSINAVIEAGKTL